LDVRFVLLGTVFQGACVVRMELQFLMGAEGVFLLAPWLDALHAYLLMDVLFAMMGLLPLPISAVMIL
jgi:hypothetical protein